MLSKRQVTTSVWLPDRVTDDLEPSVKVSALVLHPLAPASQVATVLNDESLIVPAAALPFVQALLPQVTSLADQVVAPTDGGVNDVALARTETCNCLVAEARTMF